MSALGVRGDRTSHAFIEKGVEMVVGEVSVGGEGCGDRVRDMKSSAIGVDAGAIVVCVLHAL